jgi:DNA-binding transcriptional MerR regulator
MSLFPHILLRMCWKNLGMAIEKCKKILQLTKKKKKKKKKQINNAINKQMRS